MYNYLPSFVFILAGLALVIFDKQIAKYQSRRLQRGGEFWGFLLRKDLSDSGLFKVPKNSELWIRLIAVAFIIIGLVMALANLSMWIGLQ